MAAKYVVFVAFLALAHGFVKRDAPSTTPFQDLEKHAAEFQKTFTEQINSLANSKNTQDFNKALQSGSNAVLQQLSSLSSSLQSALVDANGKAKEALENSRKNIEKAAEDLRKAHPEVEQQANALKEKLQGAVQNALQETQKLAKEIATNVDQTNQKLAPKIKDAYDDFVKQTQEVGKKLHEAANKQ
ncbi:unnamed protein product [Diatraea saccharalis]|uniref:Apolipophorin-III n=1 Tax=Diatraea saccharalis TaxID=40085 RepID=A0A9N9R7I4_9NEOP|nr:unnamed protein product [Diatraea saccharalis]